MKKGQPAIGYPLLHNILFLDNQNSEVKWNFMCLKSI